MKHTLIFLVLLSLLLGMLAACSTSGTQEPTTSVEAQDPTAKETTEIAELSPESTETETETETETKTETETEPDDGRTVVKIICPIPDAVTFYGGDPVQDVTDAAFVPVSFEIKRGYTYQGYQIGDTVYEGTDIALENVTEDTKITLLLDYATRELPVVHLSTGGAEIASKTDYTPVTFDLVNTEDELHALTGGIRLRGNSTAGYDKKPYRIKFDQKVSLFGLKKAKSWVLLAEYLDPSCMHNYTAFTLGAASDALDFTPTPHHVNLYLDGEYMGIYTLCEQVQENKGRMDLEQEITPDMTDLADFNFYVCLDHYAPEQPDAVEGETYFYVAWTNNYYSLKYPEKADFCSDEQFYSFFAQLEAYYNEILFALRDGDAERIRAYLDTDSLIDHMIIDQIMGERDHVWKSFYTYQIAGEKLAFGPIWDYDYSLYAPWTGQPNEYYHVTNTIEYSNDFFLGVARTPELYEMLCTRYQTYYSGALADCIVHVKEYKSGISESLALNEPLWYGDMDNAAEQNYDFLIRFLENRKQVLDREWK